MSNWDSGFTDRPAGRRGRRQSHEADGAARPDPGDRIGGNDRNPWDGPDPGDGWEGSGTAPYPLTYERGRAEPPQSPASARDPWPPAPFPGDQPADGQPRADEFSGGAFPDTRTDLGQFADDPWLRAPAPRQRPTADTLFADEFDRPAAGRRGGIRDDLAASPFGADPLGEPFGDASAGQQWPPRRSSARRWLIPGGVVVAGAAIGVSAVLLTSGHPSALASRAPAAPVAPPRTASPAASSPAVSAAGAPITLAGARSVLAGYTAVNNGANAQRSDTRLATIETGSSFAIDAGLYQVQRAAGARPYPAFSPVRTVYYIPRGEPAGGPRWFVVGVANAFRSDPGKVTSTEYLLFTQATPGGRWRNAVEPYLLPGVTSPRIAVGQDGLATAVSPTTTSLAVAPGQLAAATASSLDGTGQGGASVATSNSGLADQSDQGFWHRKLPTATVTDTHAPDAGVPGQALALRTADGGALVFYTDMAELTITPPQGTTLHLTVPSLYSPAQALPRAGLSYLDQFAAYDPPTGTGAPQVVAVYSGLTGKN